VISQFRIQMHKVADNTFRATFRLGCNTFACELFQPIQPCNCSPTCYTCYRSRSNVCSVSKTI